MKIDYNLFKNFCPSSSMPDEELFNSIQDFIVIAENFVRDLSVGLYDEMVSEFNGEASSNISIKVYLGYEMLRYVCLSAYSFAIPSIDLVLTSTGFGVVSNQNVAPASADRVNRLITSIKNLVDDSYYRMIDLLRNFEEWSKSDKAKTVIDSLFWCPTELRLHFGTDADQVQKPMIVACEAKVAHLISFEFFQTLLDAVRSNSTDRIMLDAIWSAKRLVASMVKNDQFSDLFRGELLTELESNIDKFPEYAESSAYKANHFKHYENKKDDSCFFF